MSQRLRTTYKFFPWNCFLKINNSSSDPTLILGTMRETQVLPNQSRGIKENFRERSCRRCLPTLFRRNEIGDKGMSVLIRRGFLGNCGIINAEQDHGLKLQREIIRKIDIYQRRKFTLVHFIGKGIEFCGRIRMSLNRKALMIRNLKLFI